MLIVAAIKEEQIAGQSLIQIFGDKAGVPLNKHLCRGKRGALAIQLAPSLQEWLLLKSKMEVGWQGVVRHAVIAQPFCVVRFEGFIDRKANQSRTIAMKPPRVGPLADLLIDETNHPDTKDC